VEDPVEVRKRMQRLVKRVTQRDDYGTLLAASQVVRKVGDVDDPQAWRAAIKRQARADRIRVRTGISNGVVWAILHEGYTDTRVAEGDRYSDVLRIVGPGATAHRHEPTVVLRDGDEALFKCQRCDAYGYADATQGPLVAGDLFERDCPHDTPPEPTAITFFGGSSS